MVIILDRMHHGCAPPRPTLITHTKGKERMMMAMEGRTMPPPKAKMSRIVIEMTAEMCIHTRKHFLKLINGMAMETAIIVARQDPRKIFPWTPAGIRAAFTTR